MNVGIAGLDTSGMRSFAGLGIAGVKDSSTADAASFGIASVDRQAKARIAGNLTKQPVNAISGSRARLGDRAAAEGWKHGVYFSDYTYLICTEKSGGFRWRNRRQQMFDREHRAMPLWLDSCAFRMFTGQAPRWAGMEAYLQAIDLVDPDGYAALDVIGNQPFSRENYDRMIADGYTPFPVFQVRPTWDKNATVTGIWDAPAAARCAVANARIAATDPIMRYYAKMSRLIGLGGMVKGPIPRDYRHYYIAELARLMPDHQFWALGQANFKVVNGLGAMGLLNRVWLDGSWWIDFSC